MRRNPWSFCRVQFLDMVAACPSSFNDRCVGPDNAEIRGVSAGAVLGHGCGVPVVCRTGDWSIQRRISWSFHRVQFLDKLLPARCCACQRLWCAVPMWSRSWRHATDHGEIAKVMELARRRCRRCSSCGFVPVIMQRRSVSRTVEVPQIQFIAGVSGHSCSQQRWIRFLRGYGGGEGFFSAVGRLELSASFRSP